MPRTTVTDKHVALILESLNIIVAKALRDARQQGRDEALAQIRSLVGGAKASGGQEVGNGEPVKRGPGRPKGSKNKATTLTKSGKKRKNPWANMTAEQKAERVRKLLAGRGLKPKSER